MLSVKGDLHKETKGTPKSFERLLDEDTAILKNYEFGEYWELSINFATSLSYSNSSMKTKVQRRKKQRSSKRNVCYTDQKTQEK